MYLEIKNNTSLYTMCTVGEEKIKEIRSASSEEEKEEEESPIISGSISLFPLQNQSNNNNSNI